MTMTEYEGIPIENIKVGDTVVVSGGGSFRKGYRFETVTKITDTRIVCGKDAFMKGSLVRVGDSGSWHPVYLASRTGKTLMSVEEAKEKNEAQNKESRHKNLAIQLTKVHYSQWMNEFTTDELQELLNKVAGEK